MAVITIADRKRVQAVRLEESIRLTCPAGEAIEQGDYVRLNTTTGYWVKANATTAANLGHVGGIALTKAAANAACTVLVRGLVALDNALSSLDYDARVFVSNTSGALDTAAGTVERVVGHVVPGWDTTGGTKLLLLRGV
jgi:hypothetical protein